MSEGRRALAADARVAALRLHGYLERNFWDGRTLGGPDQGVRWHIRFGRFAKSYLPMLRGGDRFVFRQGQGYWALANWNLWQATKDERYRMLALAVAEECADTQLPDGSWQYPLKARAHLKATVEGNFAAVALLQAFTETGEKRFLDAAAKWHEFLEASIGYEPYEGGGHSVNYFQVPRGHVPNNSAEMVWVLGEYAGATKDPAYLRRVPGLLTFLEACRYPSGEFPYELPSRHDPRHQPHYLCYQYNSFQAVKLWWNHDLHGDPRAGGLATGVTEYLRSGVLPGGASKCDCTHDLPEVTYYADVLALALLLGDRHGVAGAGELSERALRWVLSRQLASGGFHFSRGDYGFLSDRCPYPRNLAMTLFHLLEWARLAEAGRATA